MGASGGSSAEEASRSKQGIEAKGHFGEVRKGTKFILREIKLL